MRWLRRILYSPLHVQLVVTRRCNLACKYCNEFDQVSDPVPRDVLFARIERIADLGTFMIELTGGEPLLHPALCEAIELATRRRFLFRGLITNAYLLNADKVRELGEAGLTHMQISVDGATPNDVTVKVLRPLKPKLKAVAENARFKVTLSAVVGAAPAEEVEEVVAYAEELGFRPRVLLLHDGDGQIRLTPDQRDHYRKVQRRLGGLGRESFDYRNQLLDGGPAPFKCRAGSRYLYVDEHGKVHWCSQTLGAFERDLMEYRYDDLVEQFHTPKSCADYCTVGCVRSDSRYDEWRPQRRAR